MAEVRWPSFLLVLLLGACEASKPGTSTGGTGGDATPSGGSGSGGATATGGKVTTGGVTALGGTTGTGGTSSSGGSPGSGGVTSPRDGGLPGSGGAPATGGSGVPGSGGVQGKGGTTAAGGTTGTGGVSGKGGDTTAGGAPGTGGVQGKGGSAGNGGATGNGGAASTGGTPGAKCPDGWTLAWADEFEGAAGAAVDSSKWTYDYGPNWYNGELQYYSQGTANAKLDGSGNLVIEARKESREGRQYTSARLKTEGKKTFTYGRFEGRMKLPYGQGMWPAFWMLGGNSWPNNGEIDIMENLGREPSIIHGTMHGPGYSGTAGPTASYTLPGNAKVSDDFHVFAIEWETNVIRWYVDGMLYSTKTPADIGGNSWVFNHGFFFILNLAVGGEWPGNPDSTTVFPQQMIIDYVRVCQR
jgi:beta-glucanase (GH16 family)